MDQGRSDRAADTRRPVSNWIAAVTLLLGVALQAKLVVAQDAGFVAAGLLDPALPGTQNETNTPRREVFSGLEIGNNYTSVYLGGGYASKDGLHAPGWRLRAVGAYGRYHYHGSRNLGGAAQPTDFDGQVVFLAAQAGYQFHPGPLIATVFAGLESVDQQVSPFDPNNAVQGQKLGLRVSVETWWDISDRIYLSADASYGTAFQEYWQLTRVGYRLGPLLAAGFEGGVLGNEEYDAGRGGAFVRGTFAALEATLSGGVTGDYLLSDPSGYVALNIYRSF